MRRSSWNTYLIGGYTHDVANDQRSAGGVHVFQVKRGSAGWMKRTVQSNGLRESVGDVTPIPDSLGEALFETAKSFC